MFSVPRLRREKAKNGAAAGHGGGGVWQGGEHSRFTFPVQGLDVRLTGVEEARVVKAVLA